MRARGPIACVLAALVVGIAPPALAAPGPPGDPEWWFDTWNVPSLWDAGARGQGMTIAEIDTGVNAKVPELGGRVLHGKDFGAAGGDGRTDHDVKPFGHGTAMASIMVARPTPRFNIAGLAPDAKVLPIAVPLRGTNDPKAGGDHLADAIRWATDRGAKIISMSLGGSRDPSHDKVPCPDDEQAAITRAISKGAIVVAAGGNDGQKGSPVEEPGVCLGVVSVGAVNSKGVVPAFSSRHNYLTVTAPGVNVPTLGRIPGQAYSGNGTSQATAITSAALALVWSKFPKLTGRQIVARLLATLDRRTAKRDAAYGFGIVNAGRAIRAAVPADAANPVFAPLDPFVAAERRSSTHLAPPPVAGAKASPPGRFAVGQMPTAWSSRVWSGIVMAVLGVLALAMLAIVGIRRSRRFAALGPDADRRPKQARRDPDAAPIPTYRDEAGLIWHDLSPPPDPPG
ncbi:MAG TPA: S8 family serine peptidase [Jatrophihabitantaceae bacterium]